MRKKLLGVYTQMRKPKAEARMAEGGFHTKGTYFYLYFFLYQDEPAQTKFTSKKHSRLSNNNQNLIHTQRCFVHT